MVIFLSAMFKRLAVPVNGFFIAPAGLAFVKTDKSAGGSEKVAVRTG